MYLAFIQIRSNIKLMQYFFWASTILLVDTQKKADAQKTLLVDTQKKIISTSHSYKSGPTSSLCNFFLGIYYLNNNFLCT